MVASNPSINKSKINLPYEPTEFPRELSRHYISASDDDIAQMLNFIGLTSTDELFEHIPTSLQFRTGVDLPDELTYEDAVSLLAEIGNKT
ncbi:MAG: hypothetical protein HOI70_11530, partial [Opitutae bacterium]|nr:hypothetical protein [Opitutae bacterium]